MSDTIWESPVPSSGFMQGVEIEVLPRRQIALNFDYEDEDDLMCHRSLRFGGVFCYKVTYLPALRSEDISEAYDRVVDMGESVELKEVTETLKKNFESNSVRHYRMCFDDGPCLDIIANSFEEKVS